MKRFLLISLLILVCVTAGGYYLYRAMMPEIIAEAMVSDDLPEYIPRRLQTRVEAMRKPINKGTEAMIESMHDSELPMQKVLEAVDNITEDQAYAFLDEFSASNPSSTDEIFNLAKKHFPTDFNPEIFREPIKKHFEFGQIKGAIDYASFNRSSHDIDIATAKAIFKKIITEKEKEVLSEKTTK
jgi:hypothetical protein